MSATKKTRAPKSQTKPPFVQIPDSCPSCQATELELVPNGKRAERQIVGMTREGFAYGAIRWETKRCKCGQHVAVRTYLARGPSA